MLQKRQILINAIMSVLQILASSVVLFVLYRFLLLTIGVENLGIWSLILATTSVTRIADLGLSASVVKFVAKYIARNEDRNVSGVIQTAVISIGLLIGIFLLITYPFVKWLLSSIISQDKLAIATSILPYAFLSFWISSIAATFHSTLDGYQRIDIRAMILTGATIFNLFLCFYLVPIYGIMGLAYAQVIKNIVLCLCLWLFLKRIFNLLPIIPYQWNRGLFREMVGYGVKVQLMGLFTMTCDPVTKALLSKFGGLAMVGYYEMALRIVSQVHLFILGANRVLVPFIAGLQETYKELVQDVYIKSYRLVFYITVLFFPLIISLAPVISQIWIGHYEPIFVVFSSILGVGYFLSILSYPAYFSNLGIGELKWNTVGYILVGILNAGLGLILGSIFGGTGVVVGWAFSLALGGFIISIMYYVRHNIPFGELLPKESIGTGLASIAGSFTTITLYYLLRYLFNSLSLAGVLFFVYVVITIIPAWLHPMRPRLIEWISTLNREKGK